MDNWVAKIDYEYKNDYNRSVAGNNPKDNLKYIYLKLVDELLLQEENNTISQRKFTYNSKNITSDTRMTSVKEIPEKVIKELSKTLYRIEFHKAVFTCAAETMLFIYNEQQPGFEQLLELMNLSVFDFWKLVNSFIVVDPQMPTPLKRHFRDIEIKIVTELGWKNNTAIIEYQNELNSHTKEDVEMQVQTPPDVKVKTISKNKEAAPGSGESPMTEEDFPNKIEEEKETTAKKPGIKALDLFFRRVLHLAAFKILTISEELELNDAIKEQIWEIMKHCLGSETNLLYNRHLDQLVLCTIYGVCKIQNSNKTKPVKFNDIIKKYKDLQNRLTGASVQTFQNMYTHVRFEDDSYGNIIEFYNKIYIQQMKNYIMILNPRSDAIEPNMLTSKPKKIWALAPKSPLRENLPPA